MIPRWLASLVCSLSFGGIAPDIFHLSASLCERRHSDSPLGIWNDELHGWADARDLSDSDAGQG